jgi:pimeloyl-ACP methyl ester carboxylesterase
MAVVRFLGNLALALLLVGLIGLILFGFYGLAVTRAWEYADLETGAEGSWAWIDGQPLHYQSAGSEGAPWVVLVHDYDVGGSATWSPTIPTLLKAGTRVLAVDLKGFGHSARDTIPSYSVRTQADLVARLLNEQGVQGATVVGHGWGSMVALQLAVDQPQFVGRLVLLAPVEDETRVAPWRRVAGLPLIGRVAVWAGGTGGPLWGTLQRRCFHDSSLATAPYLRQMRAPGRIVGTMDALLAMARSPEDSDLPQALSRVKAPALVVMGEGDRVAPPEDAERLAEALPEVTLVRLPEAGHALHVECSTEVNRLLVAFALEGSVDGATTQR